MLPFVHNLLHADSSENCSYMTACYLGRSELRISALPNWNRGSCPRDFILMTTGCHNWIWDYKYFIVFQEIININ